MKKIVYLSLLLSGFGLQAQDLEQVKKAIDAEQYQKAKSMLKSLIENNPNKGESFYYLADLYINEKENDSALIYLNKGLLAKDNSHYNQIGLGHLDLNNNNIQDAVTKFNKATQDLRKRDAQEFIEIGRAYTNSDNPNLDKAIEFFNKALQADPKSASAKLYLGDAYLAKKNVNEAFKAYRDALSLDQNLNKAKVQMSVITKNAKAFSEAANGFKEVINAAPNYGPAYRELAETYYLWGIENPAKYKEYTQIALENYKKYMSLTDSSNESKMRYADFLILTKDYSQLEIVANELKKSNDVNPRIYRYSGYAAFENKNYQESINALEIFFEKGKKFIGRDYLIYAKAKLASAKNAGVITDQTKFNQAIKALEVAAEKDVTSVGEFSELGQELYNEKLYFEASKVFSLAIKNTESKTFALDNLYLGNSILFHVSNVQSEKAEAKIELTNEEKTKLTELLAIGSEAYSNVIKQAPTTQDAYANKAKINRISDSLIPNAEIIKNAVTSYEEYIAVVTQKGEAELSKARTKRELLAAHMFLGSQYSQTDKAKAIKHFEIALTLEPTEANVNYIKDSIKVLK